MPIYAYECDCGFECEDIDSMLGEKIKKCPSCRKRSLVRLIGAGVGFNFRSGYKDRSGESVHFKEPYFDVAMRRRFSSAREKAEFMNVHGIVSSGDSDIKVKKEKKEHYEKTNDTKKKEKK